MPYTIVTKDNIEIRNIPDSVPRDSPELKARVAQERQKLAGQAAFGAPPQLDPEGQVIQSAPPSAPPAAPQPSMGEQFVQSVANIPQTLVGAAETATTLATGATTGPMFTLGNTLKQIVSELLQGRDIAEPQAQERIRQAAERGMQAGTYVPQTRAGQQIAGAVGQALAPVGEAMLPLTPMMGNAPAALPSARAALPAAAAITQEVIPEVVVAAKRLPGVAKVAGAVETYGIGKSGGAAATPQALERRTTMGQLPVPIRPTKGQAERTFEQQRFEREIAKDPEMGAPLRQRFEEQNLQVQQNLDAFIEETGAEAPDLRTIGIRVDEALRARAARDKARIRVLYNAADKAGETAQNLEMENVVSFLNENTPEITVAPVLKVARDKAVQLGLVKEAEDGTLIAIPGTLKNGELWRRSVRRAAGVDPTNVEFSRRLQRVYDNETADLGGNLYKQARAARARFARDYEDVAIVSRLMDTKRGSADRAVALEQAVNNTVLGPNSDIDSLRHLRKVLQTQGDEGQQAWRELQGGLLAEIRDRVLSNASMDTQGNRIVSPAKFDRIITDLDKSGKLDFIYGKKGAENLRTLNDASLQLFTAPPNAVNTSNTASVLLQAIDTLASFGVTGLPVPIMTALKKTGQLLKERKIKQRVTEALE
jgi:hypothetical protein